MTPTRNKLTNYIHLLLKSGDKNQIASAIGAVGETLVCNYFNWENIDADGYDAVDTQGKLYEIKTMSYETNSHYVAYRHKKKVNRYNYLVVMHFDEERLSIIPHDEIDNYVKTISPTLRLNFNESILTTLGKQRQSARFQALFVKYEVESFTFK
ncbi:hypothetical protein OAO15_00030 [bacterium]|nr:hypothetical protein [bacterium]